MAKGGIILHGEQEFTYRRPVFAGDVLVGDGTVVDAYQKESKGKTMTFMVVETAWSDAGHRRAGVHVAHEHHPPGLMADAARRRTPPHRPRTPCSAGSRTACAGSP